MVLLDGGRTYLGVVEDLICHAKQLLPSFDQGDDDGTDWAEIAREQCEVSFPSTLPFLPPCEAVGVNTHRLTRF